MSEPKKNPQIGRWTIKIMYKNPMTNDWETKAYTCDTKKECNQMILKKNAIKKK